VLREFLLLTQPQFHTCREDAEDFCQDFFIKVMKELGEEEHEFAPGMFEHWLKKSCKNFVIDWKRKQHLLLEPLDESAKQIPVPEPKPHPEAFRKAPGRELRRLSQRERLIFILHYFKKRKFREIAARLHSHTNDMSKAYVRILEKLRKGRLRFFL
jgi:RNA polymerase sigma factor (sigma-70 family)